MKHHYHAFIKAFYLAISLLTRIPLPSLSNVQPEDAGRSALFYPLVGLIIGVLLCIPIGVFPHASPLLLAAIITVLWAAITGGLHLDGLADSADGWLGGLGDKEATLRIMKDPLVGAAGVIAIACLLLLKFSALTVLLQHGSWLIVLLAPVLGRLMILVLFLTTHYVRDEGMASSVVNTIPRKTAYVIITLGLLLCATFSQAGMIAALLSFLAIRYLMLKRLNGCTGDTTGATVETTEMFWLLGTALLM